jgi:hypothetical protein
MKATMEFLLLLGEMGAIVAPTYFQVPIIAFFPFFCFFLFGLQYKVVA